MSKIAIIQVGKTQEKYLKSGIDIFLKRLNHYCKYEVIELKESNKQNPEDKKSEEAKSIIAKLKDGDYIAVLDEHGELKSSMDLASMIENHFTMNPNRFVFIIGGAYGHGTEVLQKANMLLSFSKMTFSHQMIRLLLTEQIYRAFTIIKNEKYHNQ